MNFREWTLLWHNTGINATLHNNKRVLVVAFASLVAPKRAVDEYKRISSLHFLPLNLPR